MGYIAHTMGYITLSPSASQKKWATSPTPQRSFSKKNETEQSIFGKAPTQPAPNKKNEQFLVCIDQKLFIFLLSLSHKKPYTEMG